MFKYFSHIRSPLAFAAALAVLSSTAFAQADSTWRRNFRPAYGADVGGSSGLTLGTQYNGGNIENPSPSSCYAGAGLPYPSNTFWFNDTDSVLAVNMTVRDSGLAMATYILSPSGLIEAGVSGGGTATVFVPARTAYCKVGEIGGGRTSSRVDALANNLREADFHRPIAASVNSGSCIVPGGQDPNSGNPLPDRSSVWTQTTVSAPVNTSIFSGREPSVAQNFVTSPTLVGIKAALGCR